MDSVNDTPVRVFPHSDIRGYFAYLQLPAAFRSLSRPSSAPDAKAFTLCSFSLELIVLLLFLNCLSFFLKQIFAAIGFLIPYCFFHLSVKLYSFSRMFTLLERLNQSLNFVLFYLFVSTQSNFSLNLFPYSFVKVLAAFAAWSVWMDSNHRPRAYQARALTTWATDRFTHSWLFGLSLLLPNFPLAMVEMKGIWTFNSSRQFLASSNFKLLIWPCIFVYCQTKADTRLPFDNGGDEGNRTLDPLLAGQVLSQLSYTPVFLRVFSLYLLRILFEPWQLNSN